MNADHIDQAIDAADDLVQILETIDDGSVGVAPPDVRQDREDRVDELTSQIVAGVKHHHDDQAEAEM